MNILEKEGCLEISGIENFLISQVFDCGQCFRFEKNGESAFEGVAYGKYLKIEQPCEDTLRLYNVSKSEFEFTFEKYFSLDCDYKEIRKDIEKYFKDDETIRLAMEYGRGIRLLRQEKWETLCSFIISQNNNIPRIKKIIESICREYGEKIYYEGKEYHSFPKAEVLSTLTEAELMAHGTGFRAKYILDAARKVSLGETDLEKIAELDYSELVFELCKIKGVGPKVAACTALFAFEKTKAFPIDVWVKKLLKKYYNDNLDVDNLGEYAGIAQQYLFYYERWQSIQ